MAQERPVLPAPTRWSPKSGITTANKAITSKRSLVFMPGLRFRPLCSASAIGTVLGVLLAVGIVHNRAMDRSLMPG